MPAPTGLYHELCQRVERYWPTSGRSRPALRRLALLITGVVAAESTVLAQMAAELWALEVTEATTPTSIERRLRRALSDERLTPPGCYQAELARVLDWPALLQGARRVVLALDESSCGAAYHLLRVSLLYWGGALPLAWALGEPNVAQPAGQYWAQLDQVLAEVAALLPAGVEVVLVADRAYDVAPLVARLEHRGWHWGIRAKARGALRVRDAHGREHRLRDLVQRHLPRPGCRWKGRGQLFKDAGWLPASIVATWAPGEDEPVVVLTDLPPRWTLLRHSERRFWIEPGFRKDKSHGWEWEASQVQGVGHHARLLLAMAWATLLMLTLGVVAARRQLAALTARPHRGAPRHARASVFTLGLQHVRRWLYGTARGRLPWWLPELDAPSWAARWYPAQAQHRFGSQTVRP
jgi:Transposase DDE domain